MNKQGWFENEPAHLLPASQCKTALCRILNVLIIN